MVPMRADCTAAVRIVLRTGYLPDRMQDLAEHVRPERFRLRCVRSDWFPRDQGAAVVVAYEFPSPQQRATYLAALPETARAQVYAVTQDELDHWTGRC